MIDWQENNITEPSLYKKIADSEIKNNIKFKIPICLSTLRCQTQAIERKVKLITDASQKVIENKNRDKYTNGLLTSRSKSSKFNTKKDCVLQLLLRPSAYHYYAIYFYH